MEVNKTIYGNNGYVPDKPLDIFLLSCPGIGHHMNQQVDAPDPVFPQSYWIIINNRELIIHNVEPEIGTENPNVPESEGTDGGDTSINVPGDYVGTAVIFVTDGTGPKEVMGGSEHSKDEFAHKNNDMNSNDQYKQGPKTDFGTDSPKRPELEGTDGGNIGTDIISP